MKITCIKIASFKVVNLKEQQLTYYRSEGNVRKHFLDLWVQLDKERIAYSIKYQKDLEKSGLREELQAVADFHGDEIADKYKILTEKNVNITDFENAQKVISCGKDHDYEAQEIIRSLLRKMPKIISPREIGSRSRLGQRGIRATFALLQSGVLRLTERVPLTADVALYNAGEFEK